MEARAADRVEDIASPCRCPELAVQALLGPIFYQRLMTSEPFDPGRVGDLIDTVLGLPAPARKKTTGAAGPRRARQDKPRPGPA